MRVTIAASIDGGHRVVCKGCGLAASLDRKAAVRLYAEHDCHITRDQSYCDLGNHQACSGYTEDEADAESCMCECHEEAGERRRFILRVTTSEASGPSGAGDRAGVDRNPRRDHRIRLVVPRLRGGDA